MDKWTTSTSMQWILMRLLSLHRSYWPLECKQKKGPWRCVVIRGVPWDVAPLNQSIELHTCTHTHTTMIGRCHPDWQERFPALAPREQSQFCSADFQPQIAAASLRFYLKVFKITWKKFSAVRRLYMFVYVSLNPTFKHWSNAIKIMLLNFTSTWNTCS